jgi:hypothetical protein
MILGRRIGGGGGLWVGILCFRRIRGSCRMATPTTNSAQAPTTHPCRSPKNPAGSPGAKNPRNQTLSKTSAQAPTKSRRQNPPPPSVSSRASANPTPPTETQTPRPASTPRSASRRPTRAAGFGWAMRRGRRCRVRRRRGLGSMRWGRG